LRPKFIEVDGGKLIINLDGGAGFAASFLHEEFGSLSEEFGFETCKERIEFITLEEPYLEEDILGYMKECDIKETK